MNFVTEVDIFCPIINYEMLFFSVSPNWQVLIFYLAESRIKLIDFIFFLSIDQLYSAYPCQCCIYLIDYVFMYYSDMLLGSSEKISRTFEYR